MKKFIPLFLILCLCSPVFASQEMGQIKPLAFDDDGDLSAACRYTFTCGTTTNKATYPTQANLVAESSANDNPYQADSRGEFGLAYFSGCVKVAQAPPDEDGVCYDYADSTSEWTVDNWYGQGATLASGVKSSDYPTIDALLDAITSTTTTVWVDSDLTLVENEEFESTHSVIMMIGSEITTTGFTLAVNGPFSCGAWQAFSGSGTVTFGTTNKITSWPDWWKLNATPGTTDMGDALQAALTATNSVALTGEYYADQVVSVTVGDRIHGNSIWASSKLTFGSSGQLRFLSAATTRYATIENLAIVTSDTSSDLIFIDSGYEIQFINCYISGGAKSVRIDEGVRISFEGCKIVNDAAARYAIHCDSGTFVNGLYITNTRIEGMVFIDQGPSGDNLSISEAIIEADQDPLFNFNRGVGFSIIGTHFEGSTSAENLVDIDDDVKAGIFHGNFLGVDTNTEVHILCDGTGIDIRGNYFGTIASQDQITLESNSSYNTIGPQWDGGANPAVPIVTDGGSFNKVWGWHEKHFWVGAAEMAAGSGTPTLAYDAGAPRLTFPDGQTSTAEYMLRLPDDRYKTETFYVDVVYAFSAADAGKDARIQVSTTPQATGEAIQGQATETDLVEAADTNLTKLAGAGDNAPTTDEFALIRVGRTGLDGDDDTTSDFYVYGVDVRIKSLGY